MSRGRIDDDDTAGFDDAGGSDDSGSSGSSSGGSSSSSTSSSSSSSGTGSRGDIDDPGTPGFDDVGSGSSSGGSSGGSSGSRGDIDDSGTADFDDVTTERTTTDLSGPGVDRPASPERTIEIETDPGPGVSGPGVDRPPSPARTIEIAADAGPGESDDSAPSIAGDGPIASAEIPGTDRTVGGVLDGGARAFDERVRDPVGEAGREVGEAGTGPAPAVGGDRGEMFGRVGASALDIPGAAALGVRAVDETGRQLGAAGPGGTLVAADPERTGQTAETTREVGGEAADFARENPGTAAAGVAGGAAGLGAAFGASQAVRAGTRTVQRTPDTATTTTQTPEPSAGSGGSGTLRRLRRDLDDIDVTVTRDPDAGLVDAPDVSAPTPSRPSVDLPDISPTDAATSAGRRAGDRVTRSVDRTASRLDDLGTDLRFSAESAGARARDTAFRAPDRARRSLDDLGTDLRFTAEQARQATSARVQDAAFRTTDRARRSLDELRTDARFAAQQTPRRASDLAEDIGQTIRDVSDRGGFFADTRTRRTRPLGLRDRFDTPDFDTPFLADDATGRARPFLGASGRAGDALPSLSGGRDRLRNLFDVDSPFLADEGTGRARPFLGAADRAEGATPSVPRSLDDLGIGGEGSIGDLTLRIETPSRRSIDVEDLAGPDPADGAPMWRNRPFEVDPDAPTGPGATGGRIDSTVDVGGGQVARMRQQTADTPPRPDGRAPETGADAPTTGGGFAGFGAAGLAGATASSFADAETAPGVDPVQGPTVGGDTATQSDLDVGSAAVGDGTGTQSDLDVGSAAVGETGTGSGLGDETATSTGQRGATTTTLAERVGLGAAQQPAQRLGTGQTTSQLLRQPTRAASRQQQRQRGRLRPRRAPTLPGVEFGSDTDQPEFDEEASDAIFDSGIADVDDLFGDSDDPYRL